MSFWLIPRYNLSHFSMRMLQLISFTLIVVNTFITHNIDKSILPSSFSSTKSCHLSIPSKVDFELTSMTIKRQSTSRTYEGIKDLNLYWPAVSHNCNRIVSPSLWRVLVTKSIPTVGLVIKDEYIRSLLKRIMYESRYYWSFSNILIAN